MTAEGGHDGGEQVALRREIDACAAKLALLTTAGYDARRLEAFVWELRSRKRDLERRLAESEQRR